MLVEEKLTISQPFLLEVERKLCGLAVSNLTLHVGSPQFRSIQSQGQHIIKDIYFGRVRLLTAAGIWVRKDGNFQDSTFEELPDLREIRKQVHNITGRVRSEREFFSLNHKNFTIMLDAINFRHEVNKIKLQSEAFAVVVLIEKLTAYFERKAADRLQI
ncbi:hypothetical protein COCVIDRAFT_41492 [Bipolaris victoriae FI3]|uniref:Uncharacterized protein n=1 Tax=Bipolaris victoriae (strain FI3) TaxID=930091 RepID=W7E3E1_BIPV3|nr:hypothetical protein COCVIDRAFT_41492 [Bipolaris victoriae FI3]